MGSKKNKIFATLTFLPIIFFLMQADISGSQEDRSCKKALEHIGKAVKLYQKINGKPPEKLSELWKRGLVRSFDDFLCPGSETMINTIEEIDVKADFEIPTLTSQEGNYPLVTMKAKEGQPRLAFLTDGSLSPFESEARAESQQQEREVTSPTTETTKQPETTTKESGVSGETERTSEKSPTRESSEAERDISKKEQPQQTEKIPSETTPSIPELPRTRPIIPKGKSPLSSSTALLLVWTLAIGIVVTLALNILLLKRKGVLVPAGPPSSKIDLNLEITDPKGNVRRMTFKSAPLEIGRDPSNDISLDDPSVSRRHAKIIVKKSGLWLINLSGAKNTLLDEKSTNQDEIFQGSVIRLGSTILRII